MIKLRTILLYDYLYLFLSLFSIVYSYLLTNYYPYQSKYNIQDEIISGYIDNIKIDGDQLKLVLVGKEKVIVNYYFENIYEKNNFNLKLGDYIEIIGTMKEPKKNTIFNLFDYKKYLNRKQIFFVMNANKIKVLKHNNKIHYHIKQLMIDHIENIPKSSSYVKALVIGDDDEFEDDINKSYQINGVSHLFAISGSHISFLAVIILCILKKLKVEENKRYYISMCFFLFYMFLTGYAGSVLRATVFFFYLSLNKMYYFNIKTINILQLTLFTLLILNPPVLYDIGFQFSFIISLYLITYQKLINTSKNYIKQTLIISVIAFLVSVPICINNFFQINLLSPLINVFFVPYVSFILFPLSFICLFIPFVGEIMIVFINGLEVISLFVSNIKIGEMILSKPHIVIIFLYYLIITFAIKGLIIKKYRSFVILAILMIIHYNINFFNGNASVVFLDVGQGDSVFIMLPHNKGNILIDTGGKIDYKEQWQRRKHEKTLGEYSVIPYLKSIGVRNLDYLILTHGDDDHMGESEYIVSNFNVSNVLLNDGSFSHLEKKLIRKLKLLHINYNIVKKNNIIDIKGYKFQVLNSGKYDNENDNSIVLYTNIHNKSFLFTGDISTKVENVIMNEYLNIDVDILKLGHHGSITSTSELFLDTLNPEYGIIQVGINNRFGHPNKLVIERLIKRKLKVLQTSLNGSIKIIIGANAMTIISSTT